MGTTKNWLDAIHGHRRIRVGDRSIRAVTTCEGLWIVQYLSHLCKKFTRVERLLYEVHTRLKGPIVRKNIRGIPETYNTFKFGDNF